MKINLLSCDGLRPDKRAIAKCIVEISTNINESLSNELTNILLDGDIIDIEINNKPAKRIVLGDWDKYGWYLWMDSSSCELKKFSIS